jgi:hypothetical protein
VDWINLAQDRNVVKRLSGYIASHSEVSAVETSELAQSKQK